MSLGKVIRHIQFKTSMAGGKAASIQASLKLMEKQSGCIIWIMVTQELKLVSCRWLGGPPGDPLPDILNMKVARHTKANAEGKKAERTNQRIIPRSRFDSLGSQNPTLFSDAEGRKDACKDVVGGGGAREGVEGAEGCVEVKKNQLVRQG
jgi:hypothetical protein